MADTILAAKTTELSDARSEDRTAQIRTFGIWFAVCTILLNVVFRIYTVPTASMEPTIRSNSFIFTWRLPYLISDPLPKRGDIVVFRGLTKRVVGLPGDTITFEDGAVVINGKMLEEPYLPSGTITEGTQSYVVPDGCVFVMGDNRGNSKDSRFLKEPYIGTDEISAKVLFSLRLPRWLTESLQTKEVPPHAQADHTL